MCTVSRMRITLLSQFNAFSGIEFCVGLLYRTHVVFDSKTADPCVCNLELSQDVLRHIVLGHRVDNVVLVAGWSLARPVLVTLLLHTRWHIKRSSTRCNCAATNHQNCLQQRSRLPHRRIWLVSTCPHWPIQSGGGGDYTPFYMLKHIYTRLYCRNTYF